MVKYNIISTGSDGNATILEDFVLIDCGVPYKALEPYVTKLKLVLLTHIHSDHFQKRTIKRLAEERPTLRFGCCRWLAPPLLAAGVPERQIDVLEPRTMYGYGLCNVIPFMLTHNVPNCGYKVHFPSGKVIYATISDYYNEIAERMNLNHLDLICEALDCEPDEILVRVPNPEPRVRNRTGFEKPATESKVGA